MIESEKPIGSKDLLNLYAKSRGKTGLSLKRKYADFCKEMHVDNSKLWPVFASQKRSSLYYIRNKLVHVESFEDGYAMGIARHYLQWIVERCLLAALGWNGPTEVDDETLRKDYMKYHDWKKYYR